MGSKHRKPAEIIYKLRRIDLGKQPVSSLLDNILLRIPVLLCILFSTHKIRGFM